MSESPTPAALGYRMPAEWEPHDATWIAWPHERADWPGKFGPIAWVYTEIVRLLVPHERVVILVPDRRARRRAEKQLAKSGVDIAHGRVRFMVARADRSWLRDTLPTFVVRTLNGLPVDDPKPVASVEWKFNGWAKYENHRRDQRISRKVSRRLGMRRFKPQVFADEKPRRAVLEGGAIDSNGRGTLLTTEECLLSEEIAVRNPGLDRAGYEALFAENLGIKHTIWLGRGIVGDDTHGHVDDVARFVDASTVVAAVEADPTDANYGPLRDNVERLRAALDQDGKPLRVLELPMPAAVEFEGQRLPASYANFYISNGAVLVPTFNDPNDARALNALESVFPDRQVVGIFCRDLVLGLGTLHCLSREQPTPPKPVNAG
jgi:agmatine deiminase